MITHQLQANMKEKIATQIWVKLLSARIELISSEIHEEIQELDYLRLRSLVWSRPSSQHTCAASSDWSKHDFSQWDALRDIYSRLSQRTEQFSNDSRRDEQKAHSLLQRTCQRAAATHEMLSDVQDCLRTEQTDDERDAWSHHDQCLVTLRTRTSIQDDWIFSHSKRQTRDASEWYD